jgi:hypothetical protein
MIRLGIVSLLELLALAFAGSFSSRAESTNPAPDFNEVYGLIRDHLSDVGPSDLNRIAVQALISAFSPKVSLVGPPPAEGALKETTLVSKPSLFDGPIGYVRICRIDQGLDKAISQAYQELVATNKLIGMVFDLRYTDGTDYAAAVAAADLFIKKEQPLLDWGQGLVRSKEKTDSFSMPLAVLVNRQTSGAAEALAAVLRETGAGLILGSRTAGQAMIAQEYPLKDGERLRIASAPIQLGDGSSLSGQGLKPDIAVEIGSEDERAYYADAFKELPKPGLPSGGLAPTNLVSGTNRARRPRFNEAELVRERRDGFASDSESAGDRGSDSEKPVVHDPVLARALDFLKGLAVMRQTRF